jgi:hypothetical protein
MIGEMKFLESFFTFALGTEQATELNTKRRAGFFSA